MKGKVTYSLYAVILLAVEIVICYCLLNPVGPVWAWTSQ